MHTYAQLHVRHQPDRTLPAPLAVVQRSKKREKAFLAEVDRVKSTLKALKEQEREYQQKREVKEVLRVQEEQEELRELLKMCGLLWTLSLLPLFLCVTPPCLYGCAAN